MSSVPPDPFADPPFDPDGAPFMGDERAVVGWLLDYHRWVFRRKVQGLDANAVRVTVGASNLTLIGLTRHMAKVEQVWHNRLLGIVEQWHFRDAAGVDHDFTAPTDATLDEALALWSNEVQRSRKLAATTPFDQVAVAPNSDGDAFTMRWIVVHLLEEYARHVGHADLIRESIDGATGD